MDESIETYMPEMLKQEREIIGGRDLDIRTYSPLTGTRFSDCISGLLWWRRAIRRPESCTAAAVSW